MENRKNIRERDLLVENPAHLAFVRKISCYYYRFVPVEKRGLVTREDLFSAGCEGLVIAAGKYRSQAGARFTTYSAKWIKGEIVKELLFYLGKEALLLDDPGIVKDPSSGSGTQNDDAAQVDLSDIPVEEQVRIISTRLREFGLTEDEIRVYEAVNGIGCGKVTNLRLLARQMKKREMEIRRIRQSAEDKLKKSLHEREKRR